jgi:RNA polymerase sigma-70 factor (ECF subfamily)
VRESDQQSDPLNPYRGLSDEEVHQRYKRQADDGAFSFLYRNYFPKLVCFVSRRWPAATAEAEDIANEAIMATMNKDRLDTSGAYPFRRFLYRVARYQTITVLRRRGRLIPDSGDGTTDRRPTGRDSGPDVEFGVDEIVRALEECKRLLTPHQAGVLRLHFAEDMTFEDIRRVSGRSRQAASKCCQRALERLDACMRAKGFSTVRGSFA